MRVKVCGITSLEDGLAAAEAGADALGFNFYEKSPRYLPLKKAAEILRKLPPLVSRVAVFVNPTEAQVAQVLSSCRIDWMQMHGDEDFDFVSRFPLSMQIKAFRVKDKKDIKAMLPFTGCAGFLLDAYSEAGFGGSGKRFNWDIAVEAKKKYGRPVILAGGLTAENVAEAVAKVKPWAVDVASGVESKPGKKDIQKVKAFIAAAKGIDHGN